MKESIYELTYWYGYGYRDYKDIVWAKNKEQAIKKVMLSIAKNWSFCFGGGFQLFSISKRENWKKKDLKVDEKFVNRYKHYLWNLIEKGTIKDETTI